MERERILREIRHSGLPLTVGCKASGISRSTYWRWKYLKGSSRKRSPSWNALTEKERAQILALSEEHPDWTSRQIAFYITDKGLWSVSESTEYRVLKAAGKIPMRREEHCQALDE